MGIFDLVSANQFAQDLADRLMDLDGPSRLLLRSALNRVQSEGVMRLHPVSATEFWVISPMPTNRWLATRFSRGIFTNTGADLGTPAGGLGVYVWRRTGEVEVASFESDPTSSPLFVFSNETGAQDYALVRFDGSTNRFGGSFHGGEVVTGAGNLIIGDGMLLNPMEPATFRSFSLARSSRITYAGNAALDVMFSLGMNNLVPGRWEESLYYVQAPGMTTTHNGVSYVQMESPAIASFTKVEWGIDDGALTDVGALASADITLGSSPNWATRVKHTSPLTGHYIELRSDAPRSVAGYNRTYLQRISGRNKLYLEKASTAGVAITVPIIARRSIQFGRAGV